MDIGDRLGKYLLEELNGKVVGAGGAASVHETACHRPVC